MAIKRFEIWVAVILFLSITICESYQLIWHYFPKTETIEYDIFLSPNYHFKITVLWYLYELTGILRMIIWAYVLVRVCYRISNRLFKVASVFLFYEFSQFYFYVWNRNTSLTANVVIYICILICLILIFLNFKKQSKVIQF